uniref:Ig-like domain-containing protein n=1 Tax=Spermophilus dauricus TaxID=99837 RepID=A0A8C9QUU7_SPEDA
MQPPSASPCRGGISWQGVLLAVSLLTFWNPHPTAQLTIEPVPFDAAEGRDVLLLVHNVSGNTVGVSWYRGQITDRSRLIVSYSNITHSAAQGPAFSGREIVYPNGSLLFVNLTKEDTGFYTLQTTTAIFDTEAATGEIRVHDGPDAPIINPPDSHIRPGTNLNLSCHADSNPPAQFSWSFNGRPLESTQELSIPNLSTNNSGSYVCVAHNSVTNLNRTTTKNITISGKWTREHSIKCWVEP